MDDVMNAILPILFQRFMQLFAHQDSDQSALIQKQILKIFHAYTQVTIPIFILVSLRFDLASFKFSCFIYSNNGDMVGYVLCDT